MNTITDNFNFIELCLYDIGTTRVINKNHVRSIQQDSESDAVFIDLTNDDGASLNYWEFGTVADPNVPYSNADDLKDDLDTLLNTR